MTVAFGVAISTGRAAAVVITQNFWHILYAAQSHFGQGIQAWDLSRGVRLGPTRSMHPGPLQPSNSADAWPTGSRITPSLGEG